jgi:negative regulator of flagellin synthesis FlgM
MKITGSSGINITRLYGENSSKAAKDKEKASTGYDTVEISSEGHKISEYVNMAKGISDIRLDKVEEVRAKISEGTYKVPAEQLASRILEMIDEEKM